MRAAGPRGAGQGLQSGSHPDPRRPLPGTLPSPCVHPCPEGSVSPELAALCRRECPGFGTVGSASFGGCLLGQGFTRVSLLRGSLARGRDAVTNPPPSSGRSETWHTPPKGEDREWGTGGVAVCKEPVPGHHRIGGGGDEATKRGDGGAARIEPFLSSASTASRTSLVPPQGQCEPPPLPPLSLCAYTPPRPSHPSFPPPHRSPPRRRSAPSGCGTSPLRQPWGRSAPCRRRAAAGSPGCWDTPGPAARCHRHLPPWDRSINTCALVRGRAHKHAVGTAAGCWEHS